MAFLQGRRVRKGPEHLRSDLCVLGVSPMRNVISPK